MNKTIAIDSAWLKPLDSAFPKDAADAKDVAQLDSDLYTALVDGLLMVFFLTHLQRKLQGQVSQPGRDL